MNPVEIAAKISVGRACGFAGLAVLCVVLSFSFDPVLATKAGAIMSLGIAVFLVWCSWRAPTKPYKKTEVWLILQKDDRPSEAYAQRLIGQALHECYIKFARTAAAVTALFATSAFTLELVMPR